MLTVKVFLIQYNHILFVLKHHHTSLALCSRSETSNWESSSLCCLFFFFNRCQHENLVELLGFSSDGAQPCLVYEYMPNGSLLDRLACLVSEIFSSFRLPYFAKV